MRVREIEIKREKKTNKIMNTHAIVTVHICTIVIAIVHKCTILHSLMWMFFGLKCIKRLPFFILQKFTQSDIIALTPIDTDPGINRMG